MHFSQTRTDGFNHLFTDKPQTNNQCDTECQHGNRRNGILRGNAVSPQNIHNRGKRTDGVGDIVRPVAECETACGKDLHP